MVGVFDDHVAPDGDACHILAGRCNAIEERIFGISDSRNENFESVALDVFRFQAKHCAPYAEYLSLIDLDPASVARFEEIPFMPISLFRERDVYCVDSQAEAVFTSSGTTGAETSRHKVAFLDLYQRSFMSGFREFYGDPSLWSIFALLPSYLERKGSSLVMMAEQLQACNSAAGGFFMYDHEQLYSQLYEASARGERIMVLGVTFALLDFVEHYRLALPKGSVVMETGGMKGRRQEVSRPVLHEALQAGFGVSSIHSEYGMTEMLSQAYSTGGGLFAASSTLRVVGCDLQSPLIRAMPGRPSRLAVADLANLYSCSFLSTGDQGVVYDEGSFRIDGRINGEILRGCNML